MSSQQQNIEVEKGQDEAEFTSDKKRQYVKQGKCSKQRSLTDRNTRENKMLLIRERIRYKAQCLLQWIAILSLGEKLQLDQQMRPRSKMVPV